MRFNEVSRQTLILCMFAFALGLFVAFMVFPWFYDDEPERVYVKVYADLEVMEEVTLRPIVDLDMLDVRERELHGAFVQELLTGDFFGLYLLETEEFGPFTSIVVEGEPGYEVIRMGFYEVTREGYLYLHLRLIIVEYYYFEYPHIEVWRLTRRGVFIEIEREGLVLLHVPEI